MTITGEKLNGNKKTSQQAPSATKVKIVVKRRKNKTKTPNKSKKGLPNLTKELKEAPPEEENKDENDEDDEFFFPLEDAIPCDTLLAFQSLTQPSDGPV